MAKLKVQMLFEILGRPADNVKKALISLVDKIDARKGINVLEKTIHEPKAVEQAEDLFTSFSEVLLEFDSLNELLGIIFAYMPSNIEIISPQNFGLSNYELNDLINVLTQRLHHYDAIAKKMIADRQILLKKIAESAPHLLKKEAIPVIKKNMKKEKKERKSKKSAKKSSKEKIKNKK